MILGGSMARVGALSECPFQGDESIHSAGNTELAFETPESLPMAFVDPHPLASPLTLIPSAH